MSDAEINQLIEDYPFEISTVDRLESYLLYQTAQNKYNFEANKALLKNYQIHARLIKPALITKILTLALMNLPSTDYLALSYMIPVTVVSDASVTYLSSLSNLLERAQYVEFWAAFAEPPQADLFSGIVGVVESFRAFILHTLKDTFKNISLAQFKLYLRLSDEEFAGFSAANSAVFEVPINQNISILRARHETSHALLCMSR